MDILSAKNSVIGALGYLSPIDETPYSYAYQPPQGQAWENANYERVRTPIYDARQARPTIDHEGFELRPAPSEVTNFSDEAQVLSTYYAECADLALQVTGARRAYVFDHLVRRRDPSHGELNFGHRSKGQAVPPNGRIHNDYTEASGRRRLGMVLSDPQAAAAVRRYAIVNIWRSIRAPVRDTPLALCDARTVMTIDLVAGEVRYPRRTGEIYYMLHSPLHRWYYLPEMDVNEAVVFKQYDSQVSGVARFTPHAAFELPDIPADAVPRESIESRCLVVYE